MRWGYHGRCLARVIAVALILLNGSAVAAIASNAAPAPASPHHAAAPGRLSPAGSGSGANGLPSVGSVMRHVPLTLLQSLLSTSHGRSILAGGLDAATLARLERRYGTAPLPGTQKSSAQPARTPGRTSQQSPAVPALLPTPTHASTNGSADTVRVGIPAATPPAHSGAPRAIPSQHATTSTQGTARANASRVDAAYGALPISFELNRGQSDRRVRFLAHGQGSSLYLTATDAVLTLAGAKQRAAGKSGTAVGATVRLHLVGASAASRITGLDRLPGRVNYLIGRDTSRWITGVPTYARIAYHNVYRGIDLIYHGQQGRLEYDYVVAPGANPAAIKLAVEGAGALGIDRQGNLVLGSGAGQVRQQRPIAYQIVGGVRRAVHVHFVLGRDGVAGFAVGAYDAHAPLVIDPLLLYSTYLGGSGSIARGIAVGSDGSAYVTGETTDATFPTTPGAYQTSNTKVPACAGGCDDAFVSKLNPAGTALVYSTYLGGTTSDDFGRGIAVVAAGWPTSSAIPARPTSRPPPMAAAISTISSIRPCTSRRPRRHRPMAIWPPL